MLEAHIQSDSSLPRRETRDPASEPIGKEP